MVAAELPLRGKLRAEAKIFSTHPFFVEHVQCGTTCATQLTYRIYVLTHHDALTCTLKFCWWQLAMAGLCGVVEWVTVVGRMAHVQCGTTCATQLNTVSMLLHHDAPTCTLMTQSPF